MDALRIESLLPSRIRNRIRFGKPEECWIWLGGTSTGGYGVVGWHGKTWSAHRLCYTLLVSAIPDGMVIDHRQQAGCQSRLCVNPNHLEPVTPSENSRRGFLYGRVGSSGHKAAISKAAATRRSTGFAPWMPQQRPVEMNISLPKRVRDELGQTARTIGIQRTVLGRHLLRIGYELLKRQGKALTDIPDFME